MLRSARLEPVLDIAHGKERSAIEALAAGEGRVHNAESKLVELERYAQEYRAALDARTRTGIDVPQLRAFHAFISRLGDAVAQQGAAVIRARDERDALRQCWLDASRRTQSVGKVIEHATNEERRTSERREQYDSDERAQRAFAAAALGRADSVQHPEQREDS